MRLTHRVHTHKSGVINVICNMRADKRTYIFFGGFYRMKREWEWEKRARNPKQYYSIQFNPVQFNSIQVNGTWYKYCSEWICACMSISAWKSHIKANAEKQKYVWSLFYDILLTPNTTHSQHNTNGISMGNDDTMSTTTTTTATPKCTNQTWHELIIVSKSIHVKWIQTTKKKFTLLLAWKIWRERERMRKRKNMIIYYIVLGQQLLEWLRK